MALLTKLLEKVYGPQDTSTVNNCSNSETVNVGSSLESVDNGEKVAELNGVTVHRVQTPLTERHDLDLNIKVIEMSQTENVGSCPENQKSVKSEMNFNTNAKTSVDLRKIDGQLDTDFSQDDDKTDFEIMDMDLEDILKTQKCVDLNDSLNETDKYLLDVPLNSGAVEDSSEEACVSDCKKVSGNGSSVDSENLLNVSNAPMASEAGQATELEKAKVIIESHHYGDTDNKRGCDVIDAEDRALNWSKGKSKLVERYSVHTGKRYDSHL